MISTHYQDINKQKVKKTLLFLSYPLGFLRNNNEMIEFIIYYSLERKEVYSFLFIMISFFCVKRKRQINIF
jgi:hypothetical protein